MNNKVFLGGTCNNSTWREDLISKLNVTYFNPVVPDWNAEAYNEELKQREECDFCLYVLTPKMAGVYSIAEVIDDSNKRPNKTVFCVLEEDSGDVFTPTHLKSLNAVKKMVLNNGGKVFESLEDVANFLNA